MTPKTPALANGSGRKAGPMINSGEGCRLFGQDHASNSEWLRPFQPKRRSKAMMRRTQGLVKLGMK
jgi:hypothetical protein